MACQCEVLTLLVIRLGSKGIEGVYPFGLPVQLHGLLLSLLIPGMLSTCITLTLDPVNFFVHVHVLYTTVRARSLDTY